MTRKSVKKRALEWLGYVILRFFGGLAGILPVPVLEKLGAAAGRLVFKLSKKHRLIALQSLNVCFGSEWNEEKRRAVAVGGFENIGKNMLLFLKLPSVSPETLVRDAKIVGEEHLKEAFRKGKGVLVLSAHFGNWELAAATMAARGYPVYEMVRHISNPRVNAYVMEIRNRNNVHSVLRARESTMEYVRLMRENKALILATDQNAADRGVPAKFFGVETPTFIGWITLARRTGAAALPGYCAYENGQFCIFFEKVLDISIEDNLQKTYRVNAERVNAIIEKYIRRYPEQWFWLHNRWRI